MVAAKDLTPLNRKGTHLPNRRRIQNAQKILPIHRGRARSRPEPSSRPQLIPGPSKRRTARKVGSPRHAGIIAQPPFGSRELGKKRVAMTGTKIGHGRKGINAVEDGNKRCPVRTLKHRAFCDGPLSKLALILMKRRLVLRCFGCRCAPPQVAHAGPTEAVSEGALFPFMRHCGSSQF